MSKNETTANVDLVPADQPSSLAASLTAAGQFDFGSVVTLVTAKAESELKGEMNELRAKIKARKDEIKGAQDELKAAQITQVESVTGDLGPVLAFFQKASTDVTVEIDIRPMRPNEGEGWVWNLVIKGPSYREFSTSNVKVTWEDSSGEINAANGMLSTFEEQQAEDQARVLEIRRRLGDIPSLERQIMSAYVKAQLSESEDGRALLGQLETITADALVGWDSSLSGIKLLADVSS